ncbi:MAG: hypothetical protein PUD92_07845 [Clostridiales bacterium]|nr:hypothetical protein [Clostridiales bacterium]
MTKKIYTEPSMNVSLFETEDVITTSGTYQSMGAAINNGAFKIDGNESSSSVKVIFEF